MQRNIAESEQELNRIQEKLEKIVHNVDRGSDFNYAWQASCIIQGLKCTSMGRASSKFEPDPDLTTEKKIAELSKMVRLGENQPHLTGVVSLIKKAIIELNSLAQNEELHVHNKPNKPVRK